MCRIKHIEKPFICFSALSDAVVFKKQGNGKKYSQLKKVVIPLPADRTEKNIKYNTIALYKGKQNITQKSQ